MSGKTSIILSILPLIFLTLIVFHFSFDLPYWDQWEFVPLLQKSYQGNLSFNDFWLPHNVHRPFFPRLIMLGLARLTNWNIRWELVVNVLLGIGIYTVVLKSFLKLRNSKFEYPRLQRLMRSICGQGNSKRFEHLDFENLNLFGIFLSIVIFSLTQWENWVWGWQIQVFLNVFAICLGFYFLTKSYNIPIVPQFANIYKQMERTSGYTDRNLNCERHNKIYFFIASTICGIIATFSFGNGLLFWPLGFLLLRLRTRFGIRSQAGLRWETIVWLVVSILIYAIYLPGLPIQFDLFGITNNILLYLSYVTAFLGAPVFGLQPAVASFFGVLGLAIFIGSFVISIDPEQGGGESRDLAKRSLIFFSSLGLYAILSAFFTGLGRYNLGGLQAISSRYITFGNLLWLSNIMFLYTMVTGDAKREGPPTKRAPLSEANEEHLLGVTRGRTRYLFIIFIIIILISATSLYRIKTVIKRYNDLSIAQTALFTGTNDKLLEKLYYSGEVVKERSGFLRFFNLSLFRK